MNLPTMRRRLEMQGYTGLEEGEIAHVSIGSRFAPAVCLALVIAATVSKSATLFLLLMPFALSGALLRRHPLDSLYNLVVARLTGTTPLPQHGAPRRFACGLASAFVTAIGLALATHHTVAAMVLALLMIAVAGVQVTTGFCPPSFAFRNLQKLTSSLRRSRAAARLIASRDSGSPESTRL
jgi:hypothetical protein